jgi:hypothetical protein
MSSSSSSASSYSSYASSVSSGGGIVATDYYCVYQVVYTGVSGCTTLNNTNYQCLLGSVIIAHGALGACVNTGTDTWAIWTLASGYSTAYTSLSACHNASGSPCEQD